MYTVGVDRYIEYYVLSKENDENVLGDTSCLTYSQLKTVSLIRHVHGTVHQYPERDSYKTLAPSLSNILGLLTI